MAGERRAAHLAAIRQDVRAGGAQSNFLVQPGDAQIGCVEGSVLIDSVRALEGDVGLQHIQYGLAHFSGQVGAAPAQHAAQQDRLNVFGELQLGGHGQGRCNHRQIRYGGEQAGEFKRRGPGVENQPVARADEFHRRRCNGHLGGMVGLSPRRETKLKDQPFGQDRASVGTAHVTVGLQPVQIPPDGHFTDAKRRRHLPNVSLAARSKDLADLFLPRGEGWFRCCSHGKTLLWLVVIGTKITNSNIMSSRHAPTSESALDPLLAGAAAVDITPSAPVFLFGYPHVPRTSTGVHDPLYCSALVLDNGCATLSIVSCDLLYIPRAVAVAARERIAAATGIPPAQVMVTATHTHSGPVTIRTVPSSADPVVPPVDPAYLSRVEDGIVAAVVSAHGTRQPAELGFAVADGTGIGTNRHLPTGPCDLRVPVLLARDIRTRRAIALLEMCAMHPTVLHEDSTLISGDFPGLARQELQQRVLHAPCPVLHLTGAAGNQSPRHVTRANTFAEAARIGALLADAVGRAVAGAAFEVTPRLAGKRTFVELPLRRFPDVPTATAAVAAAAARVQRLRSSGAPHAETRTAECDWFGTEKALVLARAAADGRVLAAAQGCLPAEIQAFTIGPWSLVGWPGEAFVEYALRLARARPEAFLVTLANGELQGYLVTPEAAGAGTYEAGNALFDPTSGDILLARTLELLG